MDGAAAQVAPVSTDAPRGERHARAGFGQRGRGGSQGDSRRGDQSRGRGRGKRRGGQNRADGRQTEQLTATDAAPVNPAHKVLRSPVIAPQQNPADGEAQDVEAEVCFICASPVVHNSIAPCNHRTCHICALRMRALYRTKACAHCRTEAQYVIFTDDPEKRFENFTDKDFTRVDDNLGIRYEKQDIFEDTVLLLRYNCPEPTCDVACYGWPDLHRHVKSTHHRVMCDLCTRHKKVFTHEHELFTHQSLKKHEAHGDDARGVPNTSGFHGHPECGFCKLRFYDGDELFAHCRDRHEKCHICDRTRASGQQPQYYLDYNELELHFSKDHFLCPDKECLEKKFVVFGSEMDLKAHQIEQHPNGLSRDARRIDMSGFDYRQAHQEDRSARGGGRREGRGRGRGRDPNADPLPVSSAQPLRRDEIAYQRQLAIHSAQSVSTRTFGGQLTSNDAVAARPPPNTREPETVTAPARSTAQSRPTQNGASDLPEISTLDIGSGDLPTIGSASTPQERARALRHSAVTERAANLLGHAPEKLSAFRTRVSEYRQDTITALNLIDAFFVLFDCPAAELGTLIKELAELFEVTGKRDDLLKSWNDWRAINEDYPSLPGGPAAANNTSTGGGSKRILKLKSSTARSSNAAATQSRSWANMSSGNHTQGGGGRAGMLPSAFPSLPPSASTATNRSKVSTAAWGSAAISNPATPRASTAPSSRASSRAPAIGVDSFPSLPTAQKPGMNITRPGFTGNPYRRDYSSNSGTSTPVNAWSNAGSGMTSPQPDAAGDDGLAAAAKGKGKKKQTLIHWG